MVMGDLMPSYKDLNMAQEGVRIITPEVQAALLTKNGSLSLLNHFKLKSHLNIGG
jgi:hypothetical protein